MVKEGDIAPAFKLMGSDGKEHSLSEFAGEAVVLYFYPKDDTPGCTIEAKDFNKHLDELTLLANVIGISSDDYESHCKFRDKYGLKFLLLSDTTHEISTAYDSYANKGIFGKGVVRNTFIIGKNGTILRIYKKVNPLNHGQGVLNDLKELLHVP